MRAGRFLSVSILGLAINVGAASWVAIFAEPLKWLARLWPSVAALAGTVCGLAFDFAGYKHLVFSPGPKIARTGFRSDTLNQRSEPFTPPAD